MDVIVLPFDVCLEPALDWGDTGVGISFLESLKKLTLLYLRSNKRPYKLPFYTDC